MPLNVPPPLDGKEHDAGHTACNLRNGFPGAFIRQPINNPGILEAIQTEGLRAVESFLSAGFIQDACFDRIGVGRKTFSQYPVCPFDCGALRIVCLTMVRHKTHPDVVGVNPVALVRRASGCHVDGHTESQH